MKNTIRNKLFFVFIGFMVSFILLGTVLNLLFLEKFYIYKNKDIFININEEILSEFKKKPSEIKDFIEYIDRTEAISVSIVDKNKVINYSSYPKKQGKDSLKIPKEIEVLLENNRRDLDESYIYSVIEKGENEAPKLVYISKLPYENILILTKAMKGIRDSAFISNEFYIFAGIFIIILGSIFMFIFSKKITKPIEDMSEIVQDISDLNFEKKVKITSKDELGLLAENINDISDKLKISIDGLKEDIEFQKRLTRNISHEVKTPIGVIKGYAEGLVYDVVGGKEMTDRYCHVIADECDRMDNMVKELLDLSMLEAKGATLNNPVTFDLNILMTSIMEKFAPIFKEENISYDLNLEEKLELYGDYELLERAISNIIMNAVKYNNEKKYIEIRTRKVDDNVHINVYNTGNLIPKEEMENIWDVFYKLDKARTRNHGGHGLGLSIVKSIINLHGGTVSVSNRIGGVEFNICL